jgi:hypothetical protein
MNRIWSYGLQGVGLIPSGTTKIVGWRSGLSRLFAKQVILEIGSISSNLIPTTIYSLTLPIFVTLFVGLV